MPLATAPLPLTLDLAMICAAGRAGDHAALPALRAMAVEHRDVYVRDYAAWACLTIAPEAVSRRVWKVDPVRGDDAAATGGSMALRTVSAALRRARPGDTVLLSPGIYRETIAPWLGGTASAPLTITAAGPGVRFLAYDPWEPQWQDEGDGCWSAAYERLPWDRPELWENRGSNVPSNRCEQIWCEDQLLTHRSTSEELRNGVVGFATVDEGLTGGRMWLQLGRGQVGGRPHGRIARSTRRQGLCPTVRGLGHLMVSGLTFTGGAAPKWTGSNWHTHAQDAVVALRGGHHWLIEDCAIGFGDAQGMELGIGGYATDLRRLPIIWADPERDDSNIHHITGVEAGGSIVRNCQVHDHGIAGIVGIGGTDYVRITGCDVDRNGRKENAGTCEEAGIKIHSARDCLIDGNRVRWNRAYGIWLDCECLRNRVTGNLLIDNDNHQLFHEISPGPAWFDSNVVVDTTGRGTGFYTHDGNHCLVANNVFRGCATGVRVRALFHRKNGDSYTTTCDNRIACNFIVGATNGAISFMPEKPRNERNRADGNAYWLGGAAPRLRLENTGDVGIRWEDTAYGQATGTTGGGDALVDLATWQSCFGHDLGAVEVPAVLLLGDDAPELLVQRLITAGVRLGLGTGLPAAWNPLLPDASDWIAAFAPALGLGSNVCSVRTGPASGFARWDSAAGSRWLAWSGDQVQAVPATLMQALAKPRTRAPDETRQLNATPGEQLTTACFAQQILWIPSCFVANLTPAGLALEVTASAAPGLYRIVLSDDAGWWTMPVQVSSALVLGSIVGDPAPAGHAVVVDVINHAATATAVTITAEINGHQAATEDLIPPRSHQHVRLPVAATDAGLATVVVRSQHITVQNSALVSLALAGHHEWGTTHDLNAFPGGCFPDGAWAFVLYQGTIRASWRSRWDADGLQVQIRCIHAKHVQLRPDPHGWHTGCAAFVSVRPGNGSAGTEIGLALRSDTGEALCGFRKSRDPLLYQIEPTTALPFSIVRTGDETVYTVALPWSVLSAASAPIAGTDLPFSVMVSQNDGDGCYGLQWFFGIDYSQHENDEAWMGRLRLSEHL